MLKTVEALQLSHDHNFPIRIYFEDTDAAGVVYYASYLKFAERARTEMLREYGINHAKLIEHEKITFVVRRCEVDYIQSAKLDDALLVSTQIIKLDKVRLQLQQRILREDRCLVDMAVLLVCVNNKGTPVRIPKHIIEALI